ncbi:fibronectin type III-like domain-contianing protein [uncultured Eubacterium sp.]|uniref:fibronectin type III-like domain-contianing protein n=1 Tax=uncultured Eubacterium sp. TaxID=165185 RepID=UPI0025F70E1A|nr:fibronectin type III-like domain-contianing protein [uncultured Eubacterium sp.]
MDSRKILQKMTLKEKIALCSGQDFWHTKAIKQYGIEALMMCDGPHGLRKQEGKSDMLGVHNSREATCFPTAVTAACTWNPELMEIMGQTIAEEALAYGVDIVLGPGVNIKRNPLCGRNFEYFSEDPYLAGKLAESWPINYENCATAASYGKEKDAVYREGIYVGYRYYDKMQLPVRWCFGYGLSYTTFAYSNLKIQKYFISCDITNTGTIPGKEIVQLYLSAKTPEIHRPVRELKGFSKIYLEPGETKQLQFLLTDRDFCVYADGWKSPRGRYTIELGASGRDIRLSEAIQAGTVDFDKKSDEVIQAVMQREPHHKGTYTMEDSVEEMQKDVRFMRVVYRAADWFIRRSLGRTITDENEAQYRMMLASSMGSPMRTMMICGGIRGGLLPGVLDLANGHVLCGIGKMCGIVKANFSETKEAEKTQRNDSKERLSIAKNIRN